MNPLGIGMGGGRSFGVAAAGGLTSPWPEPDRLLAVLSVVAGGDEDEFQPAATSPMDLRLQNAACCI